MKEEKPTLEKIFEFIDQEAKKVDNQITDLESFHQKKDLKDTYQDETPEFTFTSGALDAYMG